MLSPADISFYQEFGYFVARGLFAQSEADAYIRHYMQLRAEGAKPGDSSGVEWNSEDPLKRFPRMIHMHRWDAMSLQWLLDSRLNAVMTALLGAEPYATQSMIYFKPAGARGQALHQDDFYLKTRPGKALAAWMALDPCDEENGCLRIVPKSHLMPLLCPKAADIRESFTEITVPLPDDLEAIPLVMQPGDVLFFNGSVVHGSLPNTSKDRFRRALIGHYVEGVAEEVAEFFHPVLRMNGTVIPLGVSSGGERCGVWVDRDGAPVVEMVPAPKQLIGAHE